MGLDRVLPRTAWNSTTGSRTAGQDLTANLGSVLAQGVQLRGEVHTLGVSPGETAPAQTAPAQLLGPHEALGAPTEQPGTKQPGTEQQGADQRPSAQQLHMRAGDLNRYRWLESLQSIS